MLGRTAGVGDRAATYPDGRTDAHRSTDLRDGEALMDLEPFGWAIGISDILQWRDCPERFMFGMQRHLGGDRPESWSPANAYGSAIHDCIHDLDEGASETEAVQAAFARYSQWLEPTDISRLYDDMRIYQERDMLGVRTVAAEEDMRFPLFVHNGQQIYFRFKLDRLYQRLDDESKFILVDYKSSKWVKSADEVNGDLQMWAYNVGVHELFPECDDLLQIYEQLSFGQEPTRKSAEQREEMRRWLITAITAMIEDTDLEPKFNEWCPWCPLKMDCDVVQHQLTDWAKTRIAALAPREPKLKKDGTPSKVLGPPKLDPSRLGEYVELLPDIKRATQVLEAFVDTVNKAMKEMPDGSLAELTTRDAPRGLIKNQRSNRKFTPTALRNLADELGPDFFYLATVSIAAVERFYGKEAKDQIESIVGRAEKTPGAIVIEPIRE